MTETAPVILNVDDYAVSREGVSELLRQAGWQVTEAATGEEALRLSAELQPQLVLLDVKLPDISGYEVCQRLKAGPATASIPVLLVSGVYAEGGDKVRGLESGADGYLVKPVAAAELIATIRALLRMRRAEEEVRRSQRELADFFENAPVGFHWVGPDGRILQANQAELDLLGYTREEYIGHHIAEFHADQDVIGEMLEQLRKGQTLHDREARLRAKDGSIRYVLVSSNVLWKDGQFVHSRCFTRDITERKQAEMLLRESEKRFRVMADTAPMMIWLAGTDKHCYYFNKSWLDFTGRTMEQEACYGWATGIHPDDYDRCLEIYTTSFDAREPFILEYRLRRYDGQYRWVLDKGVPRFNADGGFAGFIGSAMDIHERRQTEEALRASEQFNRSVLESSADCIKVLDPDGRLLAMNSPGLAMMEIDDFTPYIGSDWLSFWEGDSRQAASQAIAAARAGEVGRFTAFCRTARGAPKWWDVVISPITDGQGRTERLVAVSRDITERRMLEEERDRLYQSEQIARVRAEEASRLKDEFLAIVSHELRAPLNAIQGWIRLLREGHLSPEEAERAMETIERSAYSQNRIISDLLDVSRIITGKLRLNVRPLDPARVIEAAIEAVRPAAEARLVRIQKILDQGAGPVSGDSDRLQQIVWNLLSNAIKFTPKGGSVQVRLERVNSHLEIIVSDTGQGIKPELLPYIFDRFRQGDSSSTRRHGGLGLGLAIVRHLTEMHGGTVRAESQGEGRGATFIIRLPLLNAHRQTPGPQRVPPAVSSTIAKLDCPPELTDLRVLIVDDDADARDLVRTILAQCGAEVKTAGSADEALAMLAESEKWLPELLISDIEMPDKDGYQLIREVRALAPDRGGRIPAIALTAYARVEDRLRALATGFQMHVSKPVEPAELLTITASLTGRLARMKKQAAGEHLPEQAMGERQGR
ncbi:MAG TPA: PAS domain S-box protein [Blastocatellia bacterium]|nr:PAS domain S-box protein [Blastocatellia bacterium]